MGDVSANTGTPWYHLDEAGDPIDVRIGFHQHNRGLPQFVFEPMPPSYYPAVHSASLQSQAAFDAAVMATPWGPFFATWYTKPEARSALRKGTQGRLPMYPGPPA